MVTPDLPPYLHDREVVEAATALIARYGVNAGMAAAAHAASSRDVGNQIHFCRWRQIERLIDLLGVRRATGTVH